MVIGGERALWGLRMTFSSPKPHKAALATPNHAMEENMNENFIVTIKWGLVIVMFVLIICLTHH